MARFKKNRQNKATPLWLESLYSQIKNGQAIPVISGKAINDLFLGGQTNLVKNYADYIKLSLNHRNNDSDGLPECNSEMPPLYTHYIGHLLSHAGDLPPLHQDHLMELTKFKLIIDQELKSSSRALKLDYLRFMKDCFLDIAEKHKIPCPLIEAVESQKELKFSELPSRLGYPTFSEEHPLLKLASFPFRIYLTTSHHNFLEIALQAAGKTPRTELCHWWRPSSDNPTSVLPQSVFESESLLNEGELYQPSEKEPLVYHLLGYDDYPESLVLTEDDYLRYLIGISRHRGQPNDAIPSLIRAEIQNSALILLGFELHSWDFRMLYLGVIQESQKYGDTHSKELGLSVQIKRSKLEEEYFELYLKDAANCEVYWGTIEDYAQHLLENLRR